MTTLRPIKAPLRVAARLSLPGRLPWALLAAASLAMFTAAASGTTRAPFLIDMAHDLRVSVPLVANLVAITSISWGLASMFAGAGSDRWGRRPFLIGGPLALAVASSGVATAETFPGVVAWATLGGCSGMFTGVIFTEVRPAGTSLGLGHERPVAHAADRRAGGGLGRFQHWLAWRQSLRRRAGGRQCNRPDRDDRRARGQLSDLTAITSPFPPVRKWMVARRRPLCATRTA